MKYVVEKINHLSAEEQTLLEFHSVLNILNVISGQLQIINYDFKGPESTKSQLETIIQTICHIPRQIEEGFDRTSLIQRVYELKISLLDFLQAHSQNLANQISVEELDKLKANLDSIFKILDVRLVELANRSSLDEWKTYLISDLTQLYIDVLKAVEKNSNGRYGIKFSARDKTDKDYLFTLNIINGQKDWPTIRIPRQMTDVFRDLLLNARKYTSIGGHIVGEIIDDGKLLTIRVEDNGLGIPQAEIEHVAHFGYRGSNVKSQIQSHGGGFGLTKAFVTCQRLGGSMWIESEIGQGTIVNITVPTQ